MKICIKCNTTKPRNEFHKDNLRPDKLFPYCKKCRIKPRTQVRCKNIKEVISNYIILSNGCWEWQGTLNIDGYGVACFKGKRYMAHRLSFSYFKEGIKNGFLVCHTCDNPPCINPQHLYQGTHQSNSDDMVSRNRQNPAIGELSGKAILSEKQVLAIREDFRAHKLIAFDYGIAVSTVSSIKTKRNWSHL